MSVIALIPRSSRRGGGPRLQPHRRRKETFVVAHPTRSPSPCGSSCQRYPGTRRSPLSLDHYWAESHLERLPAVLDTRKSSHFLRGFRLRDCAIIISAYCCLCCRLAGQGSHASEDRLHQQLCRSAQSTSGSWAKAARNGNRHVVAAPSLPHSLSAPIAQRDAISVKLNKAKEPSNHVSTSALRDALCPPGAQKANRDQTTRHRAYVAAQFRLAISPGRLASGIPVFRREFAQPYTDLLFDNALCTCRHEPDRQHARAPSTDFLMPVDPA